VWKIPDRELEELFSSSVQGRRRSWKWTCLGGTPALEWYQSKKISLVSVAEKKEIHHAAKRRDRQSPDPEDREMP
jgi:hypothetical protein